MPHDNHASISSHDSRPLLSDILIIKKTSSQNQRHTIAPTCHPQPHPQPQTITEPVACLFNFHATFQPFQHSFQNHTHFFHVKRRRWGEPVSRPGLQSEPCPGPGLGTGPSAKDDLWRYSKSPGWLKPHQHVQPSPLKSTVKVFASTRWTYHHRHQHTHDVRQQADIYYFTTHSSPTPIRPPATKHCITN